MPRTTPHTVTVRGIFIYAKRLAKTYSTSYTNYRDQLTSSGGTVRYVRSATLSDWLGFDKQTLTRWTKRGQLTAVTIMDVQHFTETSINELLKEASEKGGDTPLTIADFKQGVRLVTTDHAAKVLDLHWRVVQLKLREGQFKGFRFNGDWRISNITLNTLAAQGSDHFTSKEVLRLFNCSTAILADWETRGLLTPVTFPSKPRYRFYAQQEVYDLVRHNLPINAIHLATDWIKEVMTSQQPPFTTAETCEQLGLNQSQLLTLVRARKLLCMNLTDGRNSRRRFSRESVAREFLRQPALTPQDIADITGGKPEQITTWLQTSLNCPLHDHLTTELEYRTACMAHILQPLLSPGATARRWLSGRAASKRPLLTDQQAAERLRVSTADIAKLAASGKIWGLRRPDGVWMFDYSRIRETSINAIRQLMADLT